MECQAHIFKYGIRLGFYK
uniref:Uncharacterized protein n=1 Tax=Rhizophora mucronata TaxID=61149 RepID=A0A2P2MZ11_RHIMU